MSSVITCPKCDSQARVKSILNPVRNVYQDHVKCRKCGYETRTERPPEAELSDWLKEAGAR